jgi:ketosteroid isomerase-like protein
MASSTATTTKEQLIAVVRQGIDDFLKGNIQALMNAFSEDIRWATYPSPDVPFAKSYKGKAAVGQFFKELDNAVNFNVFSPEKYYSDEDMVFVKVHEAATVKSTGKTYDHHSLFTFRVREGKISEFFAYVDSADQARAFTK